SPFGDRPIIIASSANQIRFGNKLTRPEALRNSAFQAMNDLRSEILEFGRRARAASRSLARAGSQQKNQALLAMADELRAHSDSILSANARDLEQIRRGELS